MNQYRRNINNDMLYKYFWNTINNILGEILKWLKMKMKDWMKAKCDTVDYAEVVKSSNTTYLQTMVIVETVTKWK
tara:strand:- start:231 stop:455 length:225 start_codon:yes stop_codon:yes gene_type:complete